MKRSIWFWMYFIVAIILATYFATRATMIALGHGPLAHVRSISISADQNNKDLTQLAAAAAVAPGTRAHSADLGQIGERIRAIPGVRDVAVRRRPDGNLAIKVALYRAVALWTDGKNYYPLSADGTIVKRPVEERDNGAILFRGNLPGDISEITKIAHQISENLDYLEWIENRRWNLVTRGGITVMLPEENPGDTIGALMVLDKNHGILSRDISVLDMRDASRILVK